MQKRTLIIILASVVIAAGWFMFRPERIFINAKVSEGFPALTPTEASTLGAPRAIAEGSFHDVAHKGVGKATIFQLPEGNRVLRLTNFETSNGPDVRVYLVEADDAKDNDTVKNAGFVEVGKLKGNIGDQNYELPSDLDLTKYRSVTIWCARFNVNFATAPLERL
jgi:hypothetical protein